ncbi:hypothetical protein ACH5RR_023965 [Cinchona calisaya]|uniref:Phospholipid/glycerol acyltransferase domain-containing protein n=1 Tax=Cinchona calisaya TaxID=153742 RepID=A0ABD2ZC92_9GENT
MSDQTLSTPLLPPSHNGSHSILTIHDDQNRPSQDSIFNEENPYGFLEAHGFEVPGPTTVDPFKNYTPKIEGLYEWVKILVCLPVAAIRLVLFGLCLMVGYLATVVALHGWRDKLNPLPKWRSRVMWITRFCSRCILFSFGYHWIRRKGRSSPREIAPIVVSNHVSYIEPIFFFYELFPTMVASESHDSIPIVGTIIRAMQVIYVNRFSQSSRKHAVNEIKMYAFKDLNTEKGFLRSISSSAYISRGNNNKWESYYFFPTWCFYPWLSCPASNCPLSPCAF